MSKGLFYIYSWWSGSDIEQEKNKIDKIVGDTIYFYNNYCEEHQEASVKDCKPEFIDDGQYICKQVA